MALGALIGFAVPVALAWWIVKKRGASLSAVLIGAGVFVFFALVLESIMHQLVLKSAIGSALLGNTWLFALYGGLAAGVFEETGRFLAMKYLLKKEPSSARTGVAYGVGHGGIEMLIIFGITMISNLVLSVMINKGMADTLLAGVPAEAAEQLQSAFSGLETTAPGTYLWGICERFSAIVLQLSLSVLVWIAVRRGGKWLWLYPAAILLHFIVDGLAVVMSKSASMLAIEAVVFSLAVAIGAAAWLLARRALPAEPNLSNA